MTSSDRPSEFELIALLFAPLAKTPGAFELTDDAAAMPARAGHDVVLKTDAIVEGVHFLSGDPADSVAKKALRVNLSDLAAKGAEPAGYLLALSLPAKTDMAWLEAFARGLGEDQKEFSISLLGGDTTATPGPLTLAIMLVGHVPTGTMIRRAGAKAGDLVFVSGSIGDGGGGLAVLKGEGATLPASARDYLIGRYRVPQPRLAFGGRFRGLASAALDVSDGLIADLGHISEVSRVRIVVDAERIPRSPALSALWGDGPDAILRAATAGDDYEIAFTAPASVESTIAEAARASGIPVTRIGHVAEGTGVALMGADGREIAVSKPGYTHF